MAKSQSKIVMIACINPGSASTDHTINTLRYAERLKSDKSQAYKNPNAVGFLPQHQQNNAQQEAQPTPSAGIPKPQPAP